MRKLTRFFEKIRKQTYEFQVGTRFIGRKATFTTSTYRLAEVKEVHDLASNKPAKLYGLMIEDDQFSSSLVFWDSYSNLVNNYLVFSYPPAETPADVEPEVGEVNDG